MIMGLINYWKTPTSKSLIQKEKHKKVENDKGIQRTSGQWDTRETKEGNGSQRIKSSAKNVAEVR